MIPDKIYLPWEYAETDVLPPGVTTKQVFGKDVCFIRKDALLEWALWYKEEINKEPNSECFAARGAKAAIDDLVDKLNSL